MGFPSKPSDTIGARYGHSLPRHCNAQSLFGTDQVLVVIGALVQLDPIDLAVEPALRTRVIVGYERPALLAHVASLVGREYHGLCGRNPAHPDLFPVQKERDVTAFAEAVTVVREFHSHLVLARRNGRTTLGIGALQAK